MDQQPCALAHYLGVSSEPEMQHAAGAHAGLQKVERKKAEKKMVGMGRFELPTPRTPSECSTRLSHIPTVYGAGAPRGSCNFTLRVEGRSGKQGMRAHVLV